MARGKKSVALTTITEARAHAFLKSAEDRQSFHCENLAGFHLLKLAGGGVWRWRYTDAVGKRKTATIGKYAQYKPESAASIAFDWISRKADPNAELAQEKRDGRSAALEAGRRTLRTYLDDVYRPHMERSWKAKNATANYQRIAGHFEFLLDQDMATIGKTDINDWQRKTEKKGRAYTTVRRSFGSLKTMLRRAVKDGYLDADPLANHKLLEPTIKDQKAVLEDAGKAKRRMLTPEEIQGVLTGLDVFAEEIRAQRRNSRSHGKPDLPDLDLVNHPHWFIPLCQLFLHTGLRPGDLYSLTWQELNIPFARLNKVCEKTAHAIRKDKKPAVVDMRLNKTILQIMTRWHEDQGKPSNGLVFPSNRTGRQFDEQAHRKPWKRVKELGGIDPELDFYCFRHHFISAMLAAGVPVFTVAKLAGQKSAAMIEEHYGHLCPDRATEALDIVAGTVSANTKNLVQSG